MEQLILHCKEMMTEFIRNKHLGGKNYIHLSLFLHCSTIWKEKCRHTVWV